MTSEADSQSILVQVTIVSYRTAGFVKKSLHALVGERSRLAAQGIDVCCYVIDNSDQDFAAIRAEVVTNGWEDWITVVASPKNGGFAYGNNRGFEYGFSQARRPDYYYLLNPDAEIRAGAIGTLVDFMEQHPGAGAAASGIEDEQGELWPRAFRFPNLWDELCRGLRIGFVDRLFASHIVERKMKATAERVDWFPGAAMIVRAAVLESLGGMDEAYFLYYEETDFCLKLIRNGWENWYVPASRVVHATGQSTGVTAAGKGTSPLPRYWFESRRRYFLKNHGVAQAVFIDLVSIVASAVGRAQVSLRGGRSGLRQRFLVDLVRYGCLGSGGRSVSPAQERFEAASS